jgi:tellurite methyltransferase
MDHPDGMKWNERYSEDGQQWLDSAPRQLLLDFLPQLPTVGLALDAAAGVGVNGLVLARRGLHVVALDISEVGLRLARQQALAEGVRLETAVYDLSQPWFPANSFDLILNFRFLERATFAAYRQALKPGGWLLFETFIRTPDTESDADFYLLPGELAAAFADFDIIYSAEETAVNGRSERAKPVARLLARKPTTPNL